MKIKNGEEHDFSKKITEKGGGFFRERGSTIVIENIESFLEENGGDKDITNPIYGTNISSSRRTVSRDLNNINGTTLRYNSFTLKLR